MKVEGVTDNDDTLRFFHTVKTCDVDDDEDFKKLENEEQVASFFRKYIKYKEERR